MRAFMVACLSSALLRSQPLSFSTGWYRSRRRPHLPSQARDFSAARWRGAEQRASPRFRPNSLRDFRSGLAA